MSKYHIRANDVQLRAPRNPLIAMHSHRAQMPSTYAAKPNFNASVSSNALLVQCMSPILARTHLPASEPLFAPAAAALSVRWLLDRQRLHAFIQNMSVSRPILRITASRRKSISHVLSGFRVAIASSPRNHANVAEQSSNSCRFICILSAFDCTGMLISSRHHAIHPLHPLNQKHHGNFKSKLHTLCYKR